MDGMHSSVYGITRYLLAMLEMDANLAIIHIDVRSLVDTLRRLQPRLRRTPRLNLLQDRHRLLVNSTTNWKLKFNLQEFFQSLEGMGMLFISTVVRLWQWVNFVIW